MAGVYLLPLLGASAIGSFLGGVISKKRNLTSYTLIVSSILQFAGCGLLSTIGNAIDIKPRQYVFEVILGLGIGLSLSTTSIMTTVQAKRGDLGAFVASLSLSTTPSPSPCLNPNLKSIVFSVCLFSPKLNLSYTWKINLITPQPLPKAP